MGYFSQLALAKDFYGNRPDTSFPTPLMVLKWRVIDLETRLFELKDKKSGFEGSAIPKELLHYVLPEHLTHIKDVEIAIVLAKERVIEEEEFEKKKAYKEEFPEKKLSCVKLLHLVKSEKHFKGSTKSLSKGILKPSTCLVKRR